MFLIHKSWADLKPNESSDGNYELFNDYYNRIKSKHVFNDFPKEVLEQWIHPLHGNHHTLCNYAWINYELVKFKLIELDFSQLLDLYVIKEFREYVNIRANYSNLNQFCCTEIDLKFWTKNGTWRIPPIILDTSSLNIESPIWSDIGSRLQLVEGHSRLGYLKSFNRIKELCNVNLAEKHKVYLMKISNQNT